MDDLFILLAPRLLDLENQRAIMAIAYDHPRLLTLPEHTFRQYEAEFRALMTAVISATFRTAMARWCRRMKARSST